MALNPADFHSILANKGITLFTGVPDSLLKDFCAYTTDHTDPEHNVITANEGNAIALAAGHYLVTGKPALVYMQNSGEGNAVNPLMSLTDPDVYGIPLLMLIGWRGEPGKKDEPQHVKQGKITLSLLNTLGIHHEILPDTKDGAQAALGTAVSSMIERSAPYALVVKKGTFEAYKLQTKVKTDFELQREGAIRLIVDQLEPTNIVISTTGKASRELFELREEREEGHERDFLTVGSMGHSSSIALGVALEKPDRTIYCLDGDGAAIMHMGALAIIGSVAPKNFKHIVINNGAHESVGGQPTVAFNIDLPTIAKASGYKGAWTAETTAEITEKMALLKSTEGPSLLEVKVNKGTREDLGRPTTTPAQNKAALMEFLKG